MDLFGNTSKIRRLQGTRRIILFLALWCIAPFLSAQDTLPASKTARYNDPYITWTGQYPALTGKHNRKTTGTGFADLVFGKEESAQITKPVALVARSADTLWVLDQGNGVIFRIRQKKSEITHFRNKQYKSFASLVSICSIPGNRMLFTESYLNKVFVLTPGQKTLTELNDSLALNRPTGIAWSPATGEIWVVETNAHRIAVLDASGKLLRTIGQRGTGPGEFNFPTSIWIDNSGKVYVVDAMNFRIQMFTKEGQPAGMFGKIGDATGYFARPKGIATDSHGNIYIADALFNTVQIFDQSGRFLYNFGTQGQGEGEFWMPAGIYIDGHDNIYVADTYNSRIQIFHNNYGGEQ
jgi:DNA-binding beta-propeller fold protein YncE